MRTKARATLSEEFAETLLALGEGSLHLASDDNRVCHRSQESKSDIVIDHIAHERAACAVAAFRAEFVTMMPALERTFLLHVGEITIPLEFSNACDPLGSNRESRKETK